MASDILHFHEKYAGTKQCNGLRMEAPRQATICLTQMKEEVEEMEMSGEHKGRGRREELRLLFRTPLCQLLNVSHTEIPKGRKQTVTSLRHRFPTVFLN